MGIIRIRACRNLCREKINARDKEMQQIVGLQGPEDVKESETARAGPICRGLYKLCDINVAVVVCRQSALVDLTKKQTFTARTGNIPIGKRRKSGVCP
jgi:hypothetical protein